MGKGKNDPSRDASQRSIDGIGATRVEERGGEAD